MPIPSSRPALPRSLMLGLLALIATTGYGAGDPGARPDDFMPYVQLAPFVVNGQRFAISIYARTRKDRRYAEDFSEEVAKVVSEGVTKNLGKGLVILGQKGEPHPVLVFRKFLALAQEGKLDPAVAARAAELSAQLNRWQDGIGDGKVIHLEAEDDATLEFEKIIPALPLPLEGVGAKLYQLAWQEHFEANKVDTRLRSLRAEDLNGTMFASFDWVFYLPPRGAAEQVLDEFIAESLKEEGAGLVARSAVKTALFFVKPIIRKAVEGLRQGVMFDTVVRARTPYTATQVSDLTGAYLEVLMPDSDDGTPARRTSARSRRSASRCKNSKGSRGTTTPTARRKIDQDRRDGIPLRLSR